MNKSSLKFNLVNVLDWRNATHETEHGTLPTPEFLDKLVEVILEEYDLAMAND